MITNKLKINPSKTEFIVFRSPQLKCDLSGLSVNCNVAETRCERFGSHIRPVSETKQKFEICYCMMLVLLLFMHLLVVD